MWHVKLLSSFNVIFSDSTLFCDIPFALLTGSSVMFLAQVFQKTSFDNNKTRD